MGNVVFLLFFSAGSEFVPATKRWHRKTILKGCHSNSFCNVDKTGNVGHEVPVSTSGPTFATTVWR